MAIINGSSGNDTYAGTVAESDTAIIDSLSSELRFAFANGAWTVTGPQGRDTLKSIEAVQLNDATIQLAAGGITRIASTTFYTGMGVASLADGSTFHVWSSNGDIYGQRILASGEPLAPPAVLNATVAGDQSTPAITSLATGGFAAAWTSPDANGTGIVLQRFDALGAKVGSEVTVNTTTALSQSNPSIAKLSGGNIVVAWQDGGTDGSGSGIYAQLLDGAGARVGAEFRVNTTTDGNQIAPKVAALSGGGFVVAYEYSGKIALQRYAANGTPVGGENYANTVSYGYLSAVTGVAGDKFAVSWTDGSDIRVQVFGANGVALAPSVDVNAASSLSSRNEAIQALSDGGYVAAWVQQINQDPSNNAELRTQRFDANGGLVGGEQSVALVGVNNSLKIVLTADAKAGYTMQWQYGTEVFVERFDADNLPVLPTIGGDLDVNVLAASGQARLNGDAGNDRLTGSALDDILDGGAGADILRGGLGNDRYIATQDDRVIEGVDEGVDTVLVRDSYVLGANVENLELLGIAAANLTGNGLDNLLRGNRADNVLNGRQGADTMIGGGGNDTYYVDSPADVVRERPGEGIDTVVTTIDETLSDNVENLRAIGTGAINLTGNALDNQITGNSGANVLLGASGDDTLQGMGGDDVYFVSAGDLVIEGANRGYDTIHATSSWMLGDNVEELRLVEAAGAANATGNALANVIVGNGSRNVIDGGAGADRMFGGDGSDIYIVDNSDDFVSEDSGDPGDVDEARASASFALGSGLENLTLTGTAAINGTGNFAGNVIRGNAAANVLDGAGGADTLYGNGGNDTIVGRGGDDALYGGAGDDTYVVDSDGDAIVELARQGTDTVRAAVTASYSLRENVENLELLGNDISGYGNNLANMITGTAGANLLDGGAGADRLIGLGGDDTYVVDNRSDAIVEALDGGEDTVISSVTLTLAANVENLVLVGALANGGTGNALDNRITGNDAANALSGLDGADVLVGGEGNDTLSGGNGDDILNGGAGNDALAGDAGIDRAIYSRAASGVSIDLAVTAQQDTVGAGLDTLTGIEDVDGSNRGNDGLLGDGNANRLAGLGGDDRLVGRAGNDVLLGGEGSDTLLGGVGDDLMDGGNGIDVLSYSTVAANITVDLGNLGSQATGEGNDILRNIENVQGSSTGADTLTGDYLDNVLSGLGGDDTLAGGDGADTLDGGAGVDTASYAGSFDGVIVSLTRGQALDDGSGAVDTLVSIENIVGSAFDDSLRGNSTANEIRGNGGRDVLRGGGGNDVFVYGAISDSGTTTTTRDYIADFTAGDRIDLSLIDADTVTVGDQSFAFIGTAAFGKVAGQLRASVVSGQTVVEGDVDGNGTADFAIALPGTVTLAASDFVL